MAKPNTQIHLGKRVTMLLGRLDRIIERRDLTRSQAVNLLVAHVLKNNLLASILDKEGATEVEEALASIAPAQPESLGLFFRSGNLYQPPTDDLTTAPTDDTRTDLPEPSRVATSEPMPEGGSPRYVCTRGNFTPRHYVEKSKEQLREELRQAVENTR